MASVGRGDARRFSRGGMSCGRGVAANVASGDGADRGTAQSRFRSCGGKDIHMMRAGFAGRRSSSSAPSVSARRSCAPGCGERPAMARTRRADATAADGRPESTSRLASAASARSAKPGASAVAVGADEGSACGGGTECRAAMRERGRRKKCGGDPRRSENRLRQERQASQSRGHGHHRMPSCRALSTRLPVMPLPGKAMTPLGSRLSSSSLRRKGQRWP